MDRNCYSLPKINLRDHRVTDMKRILKDLKQIGSTPVSVLLSNNGRNRLPKVSVTEESRSNSISDSESNAKKDSRTGSDGSLKDMNSNEESENCSSISKTRDTRGRSIPPCCAKFIYFFQIVVVVKSLCQALAA